MPTIILLLLSLLSLSSVAADTDFIRKTCKTTKYFDVCMSSLQSDPASQAASDARTLAVIMVAAGVANSSATSAYLSSQLPRTTPDSGGGPAAAKKQVLRECADEYAFAADALRSSAQDLVADDFDYAYVHVSAAAEYPNSCRNAFVRRPGLGYPRELGRREEGLKRICDVVLAIMDSIDWS